MIHNSIFGGHDHHGRFAIALTNGSLVYAITLGLPHGIARPLSVVSISMALKPGRRDSAISLFFPMVVGIVMSTIIGYIADLTRPGPAQEVRNPN